MTPLHNRRGGFVSAPTVLLALFLRARAQRGRRSDALPVCAAPRPPMKVARSEKVDLGTSVLPSFRRCFYAAIGSLTSRLYPRTGPLECRVPSHLGGSLVRMDREAK